MTTTRASADYAFPKHRRPDLVRELKTGGRAGLGAGLAMAVALMGLSTTMLGRGPFYPFEVIGASLTGEESPYSVAARAVAAGLLVHMLGPSLVWGMAFGLVVWAVRPERGVALAWLGLLVGATAQMVDVNILIPELSRSATLEHVIPFQVRAIWADRVPITVSWLAHLVYGLALSLHPWRYEPTMGTFD